MSTALLIVPNMRDHAKLYKHMERVVFDAFIPVVLGPQYIVARNADYWVIAPEAAGQMSPEYLAMIQGRIDCKPGSQLISLADYLDQFFPELEF